MENHRYNIDEFARRYLPVAFEETDLVKALNRLPDVEKDGPWIAGGAIRRTIAGQSLESDFDFFFANQQQLDDFEVSIKKKGAWLVRKNQHNATYRLPSKGPHPTGDDEFSEYQPEIEVQCIFTQFYGSAGDVIDSFDFTICQFAYDGDDLVCGQYSLFDLARKRLAVHKVTYGTATLRRLLKYTKQGFTACAGCLSDLLTKVADDPSVIQAETQYID